MPLESFLEKNRELVDRMLKDGLFFPARDKIIKEEFDKLLSDGVKIGKAIEKLSITYNYSIETIKKIVYQK